jgi:hypothetical protein
MITICLDQCAISKLAIPKLKDPKYEELKQLIIDARDRNSIRCPLTSETIAETAALPKEKRMRIHELHTYLSGPNDGIHYLTFKNMWQMLNEETMALARSATPPCAFEWRPWSRIEDDEIANKNSGILRSQKEIMKRTVDAMPFPKSDDDFDPIQVKSNVNLELVRQMYRQVLRLLAGDEPTRSDPMGYMTALYLKEQGVTDDELNKLKSDIVNHQWEKIPVVFNRSQLSGQLEVEYITGRSRRKYKPNDEIDIPRVTIGLSYADIVITDSSMADLCKKITKEGWHATSVFSHRDVDGILEYLKFTLGGVC